MDLLHFSDTHLGHQRFSRVDPKSGLNQREQDVYDAFDQVIQTALDDPPELVIHSGDLFDGVRPSNRALATALQGFVRLDKAGIPTVIIAGNHEHPRMVETGSPMRLFDHLENIHAVYKGRPETLQIAGHVVHAVPQCPDNRALQKAVEPLDGGILVLHGGVLGMDAFHHAEFNELSIDPGWFTGDAADRFAYVALGHYHGTTKIADRAWYAGATERMSIRESGEEKGYLRVGDQVTFKAIPGRPHVDLPIVHAQDLAADEILEAAQRAIDAVPDGAVARLRIHDIAPDLRGSLDLGGVREASRRLLHLDLRPSFADQNAVASTGTRLRALHEEFEAFSATYPLEGLDRARILALAKESMEAGQ